VILTQGLHRALQQHGSRPATVFQGRRRSMADLVERVARLAGALQAHGVRAGDRVAMLAANSDRYTEFFAAAWWTGAVAVPLNTRWSGPEVVHALNDCGVCLLVLDDAHAARVAELRAGAPGVATWVHAGEAPAPTGLLGFEALVDGHDPVADAPKAPDDLAAILYTGGTTGAAKGVMLSHANFWASAVARLAEVPNPADPVSLLVAPLFHVAGLARLVVQWVLGAPCVLVPGFRAEAVLRAIQDEGVNDVVLVPSMLQALLDHPGFGDYRLDGLRRITYGASPISPVLLDRALAALPQVEFMHAYGMTETAATVCCNGPANHGPAARASGLVRSVGRAGYGSLVRIVDDDGHELPRGSVGEILVQGASVMRGYWNRPLETQQALRDGWLHTGDAAWMDETGHVYVVDRLKDMIISGGENVYAAEVEAVLMKHPAVAACAVIAVPSVEWGEAVHAVVVPRAGCTPGAEELRSFCRAELAGYKLPRTVELREALPLSAAGKVLKSELRAPHWQGRDRRVN
jgi:long-chain acyl-CoA synthetase